jgi:hypothetical protein
MAHRRSLLVGLALGVAGMTLACLAVPSWFHLGDGPTPTAPVATLASVADVPPPSLFETSWDDHSVFRQGLTGEAQSVLDQLPGAPVYHLDWTLSDDLTTITGRQEVLFTNSEDVPLDQLVFRLYPNLLGGAIALNDLRLDGDPATSFMADMDSVLTIPLDEPLQPGQQTVVTLGYTITVPTETSGNYGIFGLDEGVLALPHIYPLLAVHDETGWNNEIPPEYGDVVYSDSGFYRLRLSAPEDLVIVTSGVEIERSEAEGRQVVEYAAGPMRDFYLAAGTDFVSVERQVGDTLVRSTTVPGLESGAEDVLDYTERSIEVFEDRFGDYPFTELDLVSTPTSALGVEYPGIIAMAQRTYVEDDPQYPRYLLESVTAHELAHQWFYSLVGNDQIDHPWLDESLAQYVTLLYYGDTYGAQGAEGFRQSLEGRWARVEGAPIPVGMPVAAYSPLEYGAIVYGRGALFFEALADEIGQAAVDDGLRGYFAQNEYGIGTAEEMQAAFEAICGCDLQPLFDEWVTDAR